MELPTEIAFDVDHLLNTNSKPSKEQRSALRNFTLQLDEAILNTEEDISTINEQILAMQAKILVFQTRRSQLVQQRRCYSKLLSPLRCLPIEIFVEIFAYATRDRPRHVLNLSAVCQLWREAALSAPMLWSTLELGHHKTKFNMDNHINSWIERAHSHPLSLVIIHPDSRGFLDPVDSALTLFTNDRKWKSITLGGDTSIVSILEKLEFSSLEMLESFSVEQQFTTFAELAFPDTLRHAPKLKTLNLYCCHYPHTLPFPWAQLTSLTISFWNNNTSVRVLLACENLEELSIKEGVLEVDNFSITLNHLRKLQMAYPRSVFLPCLDTPSIQELAIETRELDDIYETEVLAYIGKNGSTLLKLSISPPASIFVDTIPHLRSLVELKLYDNNCNQNKSMMMFKTLSSLVVKPEMEPSTIPLPRLEVLEITCHATKANQKMFMKVIGSRWWSDEEENARQKRGQSSLSRIKRSVLMNVHTELGMFYRDDVNLLRAQGMSIEYLAPFDGMEKDDF